MTRLCFAMLVLHVCVCVSVFPFLMLFPDEFLLLRSNMTLFVCCRFSSAHLRFSSHSYWANSNQIAHWKGKKTHQNNVIRIKADLIYTNDGVAALSLSLPCVCVCVCHFYRILSFSRIHFLLLFCVRYRSQIVWPIVVFASIHSDQRNFIQFDSSSSPESVIHFSLALRSLNFFVLFLYSPFFPSSSFCLLFRLVILTGNYCSQKDHCMCVSLFDLWTHNSKAE